MKHKTGRHVPASMFHAAASLLSLLVMGSGVVHAAPSTRSVEPVGVAKFDRQSLERSLPTLEAAHLAAPGNDAARRAYADTLFKLGDIWRARDMIAPLATARSSNVSDLRLGAHAAYLLGDYTRAETLYARLAAITAKASEDHTAAVKGLVYVYYQTNRYAKAKGLTLPSTADEGKVGGIVPLLTFMQRFEGKPYQIAWATRDKVAHLPIINDFMAPGTLPLFRFEINGQTVEFILDTGGDRLYIDEGVAARLGIRTIAHTRSRYAYTKGETVDEPLGVADTVKLGEVTLSNVPVTVAKWKARGIKSDGVITTQILKQFLSTVDYTKKELTFRERSETGRRQFLESAAAANPVTMKFYMANRHLMFAKGSLNGHGGLNIFLDSGLAASVPLVMVDETVAMLGLTRTPVAGQKFYTVPIQSHGIGTLLRGPTQALGNVFVDEDMYRINGFVMDALISHEYLKHLGAWTIDFDTMTYQFPGQAGAR